jgi:hypothetical protein
MTTPDDALAFCLRARTRTYAAQVGRTEPLLPASEQFEFADGAWLYRDVFYQGNGLFSGLETVFHEGRPVWTMAYFGDYSRMTEQQADGMLQPALMALWDTTRTHVHVDKELPGYRYTCAGEGSAGQLKGREEILVDERMVYWFEYAGGFIG